MSQKLLEYSQEHISEHVVAVEPIGFWNGYVVFDFILDSDDYLLGPPQYILMDADENIRVTVDDEGMEIFDSLQKTS